MFMNVGGDTAHFLHADIDRLEGLKDGDFPDAAFQVFRRYLSDARVQARNPRVLVEWSESTRIAARALANNKNTILHVPSLPAKLIDDATT